MKKFTETKLAKWLKRMIQDPKVFWICASIILAGPLLWNLLRGWNNLTNDFWGTVYNSTMEFAMGMLPEVVAAVLIGWGIYLYQKWFRETFLTRESVTIRVPLMLGSAPIFVSHKLKYFENEKIKVDLDFRYAGIDTLEDLRDNKCQFAVASDVAITSFLSNNTNIRFKIYSLPFVKISGHIKILVKQDSQITKIDDLAGKRVAFIKDSVHDHFFDKVIAKGNVIQCTPVEKNTVMQCFKEVVYGSADACIFWEPHYLSMQNNFGLKEIAVTQPYEWFLCLVTTQEYYNEKENLHKKIFKALSKAVNECEKDKSKAAHSCYEYMLEEFTGVSEQQLLSILIPPPPQTPTHFYKIDADIKKSYEEKLTALFTENYYKGSSQFLLSCSWPE